MREFNVGGSWMVVQSTFGFVVSQLPVGEFQKMRHREYVVYASE